VQASIKRGWFYFSSNLTYWKLFNDEHQSHIKYVRWNWLPCDDPLSSIVGVINYSIHLHIRSFFLFFDSEIFIIFLFFLQKSWENVCFPHKHPLWPNKNNLQKYHLDTSCNFVRKSNLKLSNHRNSTISSMTWSLVSKGSMLPYGHLKHILVDDLTCEHGNMVVFIILNYEKGVVWNWAVPSSQYCLIPK